jgi:hypothetical protein
MIGFRDRLGGRRPSQLLKRDQDRITEQEDKAKTELAETEADFDKWQEVLTVAI